MSVSMFPRRDSPTELPGTNSGCECVDIEEERIVTISRLLGGDLLGDGGRRRCGDLPFPPPPFPLHSSAAQ